MSRRTTASSHASLVHGAIQGGLVESSVEAHVTKSWDRCINLLGIEPNLDRDTAVLEAGALRQRQQRFGELLNVARVEMENLYEQIAGSGYAVILTDAEGTILNSISDTTLKKEFRQAGLWLGAVWDEQHQGTNGIGTCIIERRPVNIHREEHFMGYNVALSCSGAPIVGAQGELLAILDASSVNSNDTKAIQRHTMALVNMSASLISKNHFINDFQRAWVIRFHSRPEFVGLLNEALIAVDSGGAIVGANQSAIDQLGVSDRKALIGLPVEHVFQFDFAVLEQRGASDPSTVWPVRDAVHNRRFFALVRAPRAAARAEIKLPRLPMSAAERGQEDQIVAAIGSDVQMRKHLSTARQLIEKQVSILLTGATGTGKEAFAKTLHRLSSRSDKPFVAVNCAAIPESLIESELFGYARGAFTDASREGRRGKIVQANGGTLFLDEIGDMPLALQTRLLRVLEEREVVPLGGEQAIHVDLHVVSATHRDVRQMIAEGIFREDLYYRLNGITLALPTLRERTDKLQLIGVLLANEAVDGKLARVHPDAERALINYLWPGNIRQLRNVLRTAAALCSDDVIRIANLPQEILDSEPAMQPSMLALPATMSMPAQLSTNPLHSAERSALIAQLERWHWNVTKTAEMLNISRNTLYRKLRKHDIPLEHGTG